MDWQAALKLLRLHLPSGREAWGVRGSLRWLEEAMRARGANPSSVRNIVYRGVGTAADQEALHALISDLAAEVGVSVPPLPEGRRPALPAELELLGRQKRRAYRQFLAAVRQPGSGTAGARLVVSGPPGAGKNLLGLHLERALARPPTESHAGPPGAGKARPGAQPPPWVRRLTLSGDVSALFPGLETSAAQPYAVQAEAQARAARALLGSLEAGSVLLLRVERGGVFGDVPPRAADGAATSLTAWAAEHLYRRAPMSLNVLLAAEDDAALPAGLPGDHIRLAPPTPAEARRYLMAQLGLPAAQADDLVRQTGRNLDRLTLLAAARSLGTPGEAAGTEGDVAARLLADPAAARLLSALAAGQSVSPEGETGLPRAVLDAALGHPVAGLPAHVRALLDDSGPDLLRPLSPALLASARPHLPPTELTAALTRLAAGTDPDRPELAAFHLSALSQLGRWSELDDWLSDRPGGLAHAPALWAGARGRVRGEAREALARAVVGHHAMLGAYSHPQARDALFALLDSPTGGVRAWARVKLAESSVDSGNFEAAEAQLQHPEVSGPLQVAQAAPDRWLQAAQADALLVGAALARWRGDLDLATTLAEDDRTRSGGRHSDPARASLWRGLIAKDAGRWDDAVRQLSQVPASHPLLSARARYQEGDLRLRLGQPAAALALLQGAARQLEHERGSPEEQARALGRIATALRRLGQPAEALVWSQRATALAGDADPVLRARLDSETVPVLLALFRPDEALRVAARALDLLARPGQRRAEAAYRERRTHYRVALAYLTRGAGHPYLPPFGGVSQDTPDTAQARRILDRLLARKSGASGDFGAARTEVDGAGFASAGSDGAGSDGIGAASAGLDGIGADGAGSAPAHTDSSGLDREQVLTFDILLSRSLAEPQAERALEFAVRALAMTDHPYAETQARATLADAHLRAGQPAPALHQINRAHALLRRVASGPQEPDPGLHALLLTLEARCLLQEDPARTPRTLAWLRGAASDGALHPFRAQMWREIGRELEGQTTGQDAALAVFPGLSLGLLRLRDALSLAACPD